MKVALFWIVVVGVGIGASIPAPSTRETEPAAAAVSDGDDAPAVDTVLERSPGGHFYAVADVNGEPIRFLVDTGASTIALTEADAKRAHLVFDPSRFEPVAKGAAGVVRGQEVAIARIALDGKRAANLRGVVMADSEMSLLGQNYLRGLDVTIKGDTMTLR